MTDPKEDKKEDEYNHYAFCKCESCQDIMSGWAEKFTTPEHREIMKKLNEREKEKK